MAGFDNEVVYADNVDFSGGFPVTAQVTSDGELLIGSTASPNIRVGNISSSNGTITITNGPGTIDIVASGGAVAQTLTGNSGVATPSLGNINVQTSNATVKFTGSGSTITQDFNLTNTVLGSSLPSLTVGTANTGLGSAALNAVTSGVSNTAVGFGAGDNINTGNENTLVGRNAGGVLTGGGQNVCVGLSAGSVLTGGSSNVFIGRNAGNSFSNSVNNNICIGDSVTGSGAVSNSIRIGGSHTTTFIDGITGVTVAASAPVGVDTNDQLSSLGFGTSGQSLVSGGAGVSPSWSLINTNNFSSTVTFTSTQPSMLAYKSANTTNTTGDGTLYTVIFDTETYDQGSNYNNATGVFTCPVTGNYMITGNVGFSNFGTSTTFATYVTAVPLYQTYNSSQAVANVGVLGNIWCPFSSILRLTSGTTISIQAQGNGGALNNTIIGGGAYATWLSIVLVN